MRSPVPADSTQQVSHLLPIRPTSSVASLIRCRRGVAGQGARGRDAVRSRLYTAWAANCYPSLLGYQQPADAQIIGS